MFLMGIKMWWVRRFIAHIWKVVGTFLSRRRHPSVAMQHLPLGEITLLVRLAETSISYLTFSITKTPVILRMTN